MTKQKQAKEQPYSPYQKERENIIHVLKMEKHEKKYSDGKVIPYELSQEVSVKRAHPMSWWPWRNVIIMRYRAAIIFLENYESLGVGYSVTMVIRQLEKLYGQGDYDGIYKSDHAALQKVTKKPFHEQFVYVRSIV